MEVGEKASIIAANLSSHHARTVVFLQVNRRVSIFWPGSYIAGHEDRYWPVELKIWDNFRAGRVASGKADVLDKTTRLHHAWCEYLVAKVGLIHTGKRRLARIGVCLLDSECNFHVIHP